jgi:uncharacterized protein (DUF305 family)
MEQGHEQRHAHGLIISNSPYLSFAMNLAASGIVMYLVMYTMIDRTADLYNNLNNLYMTLMMVTSMALLMLWMMHSMFPNRRINFILYSAFAILFLGSLWGMRTQALIGDRQFLRSMIPHHSGAILMCEKSSIRDPEIKQLCEAIVSSQKTEITQMKAMLAR